MPPAGRLVILCEDDPVALDRIHGADLLAVGPEHHHMFGHPAHMLALGLALLSPAAELLLEFRLMFASIFVIVAVELLDLPVAPFGIVAVMMILVAAALLLLGLRNDRG